MLDWATEGGDVPSEISSKHFGRSTQLIEEYFLPMAKRSYAGASVPKSERAARQLVELLRAMDGESFGSREILRMERAGLSTAADLNQALAVLEEGDLIRAVEHPPSAKGGRPSRMYLVNPAIHTGRR